MQNSPSALSDPAQTSHPQPSGGRADGAPGPGAVRAADGFSIKMSIAAVVVLAMLVVALALTVLGWTGARQTLLQTAQRTAADAGRLITERSRRLIEPAQASLRQIGLDPITEAVSLPERLQRLFVLSEEIANNPLIDAIYIGYGDGQFFLLRSLKNQAVRDRFNPPSGARMLVQSRAAGADGKLQGEYLFYSSSGQLLLRRAEPDYVFDPRSRPWYVANHPPGWAKLSQPYVFFTTRQVGLTISLPSRSRTAVVGIDMVLDDLGAQLDQMRISPGGQLALVNPQREVIVYPDMQQVLVQAEQGFRFRTVQALGEPSLMQLDALNAPVGQPQFMDVGGRETLGVVLPFDVWHGQPMKLLVTAPVHELLGDLRHKLTVMLWLIAGIVLVMLPLGWLAGARVGARLDHLTQRARQIARFDFSGTALQPTFIREVNQLADVMGDMSVTIQHFLALSQTLAGERQMDQMLAQVLTRLIAATRCQAGAVYLWHATEQRMQLAGADAGQGPPFEPQLVYPGVPGLRQVGRGLSQMAVELRGRNGPLQGLLLLVYPDDAGHRDDAFQRFAHQLSGMLAVSIETRQLIESQKTLFDAVIRLMADAIDAKSPYTGGHCERVPQLAALLADRMCADPQGPYADFTMTDDERYEFRLGAWLHDCGKVTSPEHIVDKATKLEVIYNRIHEVRTRFEVLWRDAEIAHLRRLQEGADAAASAVDWAQAQQRLQEDFAFVAQCNVGGEFMADAAMARLQQIAAQTWLRHFDNRLGLASEELRRLQEVQPQAPLLPVAESLLSDRPEHVVPWGERKPAVEKSDPNNKHGFDMVLPQARQNMGELYNLSIRRGTLTDEDRFKINEHIVQTLIMLRALPWPAHLARVPDIASTHHEKMDGRGYPRRLPGAQLTLLDRVMALADIFEALTAADRPYKAPKSLTESLRIMAFMCKDQHLDVELFRYFLHSGVWQEFAQRFMQAAQIDAVDVAAIEQLLPAAPVNESPGVAN